jgi:hypothetical protein
LQSSATDIQLVPQAFYFQPQSLGLYLSLGNRIRAGVHGTFSTLAYAMVESTAAS